MKSFANVTKVEKVTAGFLSGSRPFFPPSIPLPSPLGRDLVDGPRGGVGAGTQEPWWWEEEERGCLGRHPVTSQPEVAPALDGHECLAEGLGVKSHFLQQARARAQRAPGLTPPGCPPLCLGTDAVNGEGTPQGSATLVGRH